MNNLTIVIPFYNGHQYIHSLLGDIPKDIPVIVVDDHSEERLLLDRDNTVVVRPERKGYFSGAVNVGLGMTSNDVLVLNQDIRLTGTKWMDLLAEKRQDYALIGERITGNHPAFPNGYVHGVFQFMRRDAIQAAGGLDAKYYPLWGGSALWQWQICRKGFRSLPMERIPGMSHWHHTPTGDRYGSSIRQLLVKESSEADRFIRTPPAISVIVPCYNYGRYLSDCLNSLIGGDTSLGRMPGQTFQSFEVLIIDDGSTDSTAEIAKSYVDGWNGIRYFHQQNRGLPVAENVAIRRAIGKYITILSADDMREPWGLQNLYDAAIANPKSVTYDELMTFEDGERKKVWGLSNYDFESLLERNMMHAGILFPKAGWEEAGGYPEEFVNGREDWAFNVALGEKGYCGLKVDRPGYLYRREGQNRTVSNTTAEWRERFMIQMQRKFAHLYRGERTMACCGQGGGRQRTIGAGRGAARTMSIPGVPNSSEMVMMEYVGTSIGSKNWGGPGGTPSGRYYRFGSNSKDKVKYVEQDDVEWLRELVVDGKPIFQLFSLPTSEELGLKDAPSGDVVPVGELTVKVNRQVEIPDPEELTVAEIKELDLDRDQWLRLAEVEALGKNRVTVIAYAKEQSSEEAS